jgi:hypothetical protein
LLNATGSGVTFSTTLGSSFAPAWKAIKVKMTKPNIPAANLIESIKLVVARRVNASMHSIVFAQSLRAGFTLPSTHHLSLVTFRFAHKFSI